LNETNCTSLVKIYKRGAISTFNKRMLFERSRKKI